MKKHAVITLLGLVSAALLIPAQAASNPELQIQVTKPTTGSNTSEQIRVPNQPMIVNPATSNQQPTQPKIVTPPSPNAYTAQQNGSLNVLNCTGQNIQVMVYNGNDTVRMIPYMTANVAHNRTSQKLSCNAAPCQLRVGNRVGRVSWMGPHVLKRDGSLVGTNTEAQKSGCSIY